SPISACGTGSGRWMSDSSPRIVLLPFCSTASAWRWGRSSPVGIWVRPVGPAHAARAIMPARGRTRRRHISGGALPDDAPGLQPEEVERPVELADQPVALSLRRAVV